MKTLFLIHVIIMLIPLIICSILALRKKEPMSGLIAQLLNSGVCTIISYALTIHFDEPTMGIVFSGIYFASLTWLLYLLLLYVKVFDDGEQFKKSSRIIKIVFLAITILDVIQMVANIWTKHVFTLFPVYIGGEFIHFEYMFSLAYQIHLGYCYLLSLSIVSILIYKAVTAINFYRNKYIVIIIAFIFVLVVNLLFMLLDWPYDFSVLTYEILALIIWYQTFYGIPKEQQSSIISIISQNINCAIVCFDNEGHYIYSNKIADEVFVVKDSNKHEFYESYRDDVLQNTLAKTCDHFIDQDIFIVNGEECTFSREIRTLRDNKNRIIGSYIKMDDHTSDIRHIKRETYNASHDLLTGLYNLHGFTIEAKKILDADPDTPRYFVVSNIQNFKLINEELGAEKCDMILKAHADIQKNIQDKSIIIGRISADRFAYLVPKKTFTTTVIDEKIQKIKNSLLDSNYDIKVNLGIYEISNTKEAITSMYDKACMAIDRFRNEYMSTVQFYDTSIMKNLKKEKTLIGEFPTALANREFCMFLQPQTNTKGTIIGAEALVRWNKPGKGLVPPFEFIPILEKTGYIHLLDSFIWEEAAAKLADWKKRGILDKHISVNISAKDFYYTDIYTIFTSLVKKYDINPANLKLEITETALMHNIESHMQILENLKKHGFCIEMDDFGAGYSSLNMLKDINVDVVKIDMGFLRKTENEERANTVLKHILTMTQKLGMRTVCEGVETIDQINNLTNMGCDIFQGYYFSKPIPVDEFEAKYFKGESV